MCIVEVMKNFFIRKPLTKQSSVRPDSVEVKGAALSVGNLTVRCTIKQTDGHAVMLVSVPARQSKKVTIETTKQVHALVSTPISTDQRVRASKLAEKARDARTSNVTARFRQMAHAV